MGEEKCLPNKRARALGKSPIFPTPVSVSPTYQNKYNLTNGLHERTSPTGTPTPTGTLETDNGEMVILLPNGNLGNGNKGRLGLGRKKGGTGEQRPPERFLPACFFRSWFACRWASFWISSWLVAFFVHDRPP